MLSEAVVDGGGGGGAAMTSSSSSLPHHGNDNNNSGELLSPDEYAREQVDLGYASSPNDETTTTTTTLSSSPPTAATTPITTTMRRREGNGNNNTTTTTTTSTTPTTIPTRMRMIRDDSVATFATEGSMKQSGLFGTSSNLVNTIVGAGIIGIPYAFRQCGFIVGLLLLVFVGYLTDKSLRILIDVSRFHPKLRNYHVTSFEKLAYFPFGLLGRYFILLNMFVLAYGAMVAYLLIIKDTVPTLMGVAHGIQGGLEREMILIITSVVIMLPLSMQRDMATLSFTSCISVTADILLVVFVLIFSPVETSISEAGGIEAIIEEDGVRSTLFIGLGVLSTAMACQHSSFIISGSLVNITRKRWCCVTGFSISLATFLCAILGSAGYLGFLEETQGDVLNNFEHDSIVANAARALLAITMFFTYPMESFVGRHVLSSILYHSEMEGTEDMPSSLTCMSSRRGLINRRHKLTLSLYIMSLIPALIFDDLGPVLSITGSIGGSCLAYIAPGLIYLAVNGEEFMRYCECYLLGRSRRRRRRRRRKDGGAAAGAGEIELPTAGDANARQVVLEEGAAGAGGDSNNNDDNMELPVEGQRIIVSSSNNDDDDNAYYAGSKPCWWYIFGFPLWYAIASMGANNMRNQIQQQHQRQRQQHVPIIQEEEEEDDDDAQDEEDEQVQQQQQEQQEQEEEILPKPNGYDYFIAIMFVTFGLVAAVAGLASNIWVQIHGIAVGLP